MLHFDVFGLNLYIERYVLLYLNPSPRPWIFNPPTGTLQRAIPFDVRTTFLSTAWPVFPVLYKSVFFPDYLLLINLFFLRGQSISAWSCLWFFFIFYVLSSTCTKAWNLLVVLHVGARGGLSGSGEMEKKSPDSLEAYCCQLRGKYVSCCGSVVCFMCRSFNTFNLTRR